MKLYTFFILLLFNSSCIAQKSDYPEVFSSRADSIIFFAADRYQLPRPDYADPEKVYWPAVIARLSKYGEEDSLANAILDYPLFKNRRPFHFILVGMARIMPLFPDAPSMKKNKLQYLKNVADRKDSYNPWTCEGTENHINMSRTSGYIFAEQMLEYPEIFPKAEEWRLMMKEWLRYYAGRIYEVGTGEFNASTYGIFNIIGFLNLYDFARDPEVKSMAKAVLDYFACELALNNYQGMTAGPESRGAPSINSLAHETEWLSWLWFGGITKARENDLLPGRNSKIPLQSVHAATSNYRPDTKIIELSEKKYNRNHWYVNSKPSYLLAEPGYIRHVIYQNSSYSLGSAMYPYGAYGTSAYKNTTWKLLLGVDNTEKSPGLITGGGGYYKDRKGMVRNPYTQVAQYRNVLVMLNLLPENYPEINRRMESEFKDWRERWERDFIKRFSADDEKITHVGNPVKFMETDQESSTINSTYVWHSNPIEDRTINNILFLEYDKAFVAISSVYLKYPLSERDEQIIDYSPPGKMCGLVLEVTERYRYENFDTYIDAFSESDFRLHTDPVLNELSYQSFSGFELKVRFSTEGTFTEPIYDWGYGPDTQMSIQTSPPFIQPEWPEGEGFGRIPEIWLNGEELYRESDPAIYEGPNLLIRDRKILIKDRENEYLLNSLQ